MSSASLTKRLKRRSRTPLTRWTGLTLVAVVLSGVSTPSMAQQPANQNTPLKLALNLRATSSSAYTLGAGDRLRMDVFNVPEYSGEFQVLVDGTINLPIAGSVSVQGLTLQDASSRISNEYARYLKRPIVTLSLLAPRPLQIGVSGEVVRAGSYTVPVTNGSQFPTVTQAIQLAGGTTQSANLSSVQIRRQANGTTYTVDLREVLQTGNLSEDISLRDGDTVFIPTVNYANAGNNSIVALSNLASQTAGSKVAVVGEVSRPGTYILKSDPTGPNNTTRPPTLTQAIQVAGGLSASANIRNIQIRRPTRSGSQQVLNVNLMQLLQAGDANQDAILQEGDTVFIPTRTDVNPAESRMITASTLATQVSGPIEVNVVGQVMRPGNYPVKPQNAGANGGGAPPTLTAAIQTAGGIKPLADIRNIQVKRYTRTGSEQVINVNLWQLLQQGDLSQDIVLQDGDIVSVPTAKKLDPTEAEALATASFSPTDIQVNVVGEVVRPGPVKVDPNTPLNQAILAAGGFNNRARKNRVDLIRLNPDGTVSKRSINVDLSQGISSQNNPTLHSNDVVVVSRSGLASVSDTLSTVLSPVGAIFSLFNFFRY